jgi:hypothetical protein
MGGEERRGKKTCQEQNRTKRERLANRREENKKGCEEELSYLQLTGTLVCLNRFQDSCSCASYFLSDAWEKRRNGRID